MNPYLHLVSEYARFAQEGKNYPLGKFPPAARPDIAENAPNVLFFAPHPDDETIQGGLALRLLREAKWNVLNVAVTQGSKKEQQAERLIELKRACDYLGFGLVQTGVNALEHVTNKTRDQNKPHWSQMVKIISDILATQKPRAIFFPHELDWNSTHIGVHFLIMDALQSLPPEFQCYLIETEFWGQMASPNLMVEYSVADVADLVTATSFHIGEVQRNPYHILLPAWLQDNVRRGAELVGGQGEAAPDFIFGQLYRLRKWNGKTAENVYEGGKHLSTGENAATLFM